MGFFNSLPVPESSKVIPAHPWREDEDGVDSDSCGSDAESEDEHVVRPYEHDPKLKCKEELEHFSQGCDNVIQSESDSEEENVDYASWQGTRKVYSLCACVRQ